MFRRRLVFLFIISALYLPFGIFADSATKSFLEILFDPGSEEAEKPSEAALIQAAIEEQEQEQEQEEPASESVIIPSTEKDPDPVEMIMSAAARETFVFEAEGEGWMLDSYTRENGESTDNLRYSGRDYISGKTVFSFYPFEPGIYRIHIRKSDYAAGSVERLTVRLSVEEYADTGSDVSVPAPDEVQLNTAEAASEPPAAIHTEPESPVLPEDTGGAVDEVYSADEAMQAASRLEQSGSCAAAAELLEKYLQNPELSGVDVILYKLAGYYEKCPGIRDERKAVEYYGQIVDYYPVSNYWEQARDRKRYLERQYIYIR